MIANLPGSDTSSLTPEISGPRSGSAWIDLLDGTPEELQMAWKKTSRTLPLLDAPVWLYENGRIYIGERNMPPDADGWLWALHYSIPWWNGQEWVGDTADLDDVHPTHWMPLPMPPNDKVSGGGTPSA